MSVIEAAPPQAAGFGYLPDPDADGLHNLYVNARYDPETNPDGFVDGMLLAVSAPHQQEGETLEAAFARTGTEYQVEASRDDFVSGPSDTEFFRSHYDIPPPKEVLLARPGETRHQYTVRLRDYYIHCADTDVGMDLAVEEPFSGPGGRYDGHFFEHDSGQLVYGYASTGHWNLVRDVAVNMRGLVDRGGFLPNASARFYADRGHIPHFPEVVELLAEHEGPKVLEEFRESLEKYYEWWTSGDPDDAARNPVGSSSNVVRMPDGTSVLSRYATIQRRPRLEAFQEDVDFAEIAAEGLVGAARTQRMEEYYFHARAGAAEGHDYHAGMTKDGVSMHEIEVGNRVQVALNSKLVHTELLLMKAYLQKGDTTTAEYYRTRAKERVAAINKYLWDPKQRTFRDFNFVTGEHAEADSTMTYPLEVGFENKDQAEGVTDAMEDYLRPGGFVFTLNPAPKYNWRRRNAWPFTAKHVVRGLIRAGHEHGIERATQLAERGRERFQLAGEVAYNEMRMTPEKVDAEDPVMLAGGGEYKVVPAFAPMAEVLMALECIDPRHPNAGPIPIRRSIARWALAS